MALYDPLMSGTQCIAITSTRKRKKNYYPIHNSIIYRMIKKLIYYYTTAMRLAGCVYNNNDMHL